MGPQRHRFILSTLWGCSSCNNTIVRSLDVFDSANNTNFSCGADIVEKIKLNFIDDPLPFLGIFLSKTLVNIVEWEQHITTSNVKCLYNVSLLIALPGCMSNIGTSMTAYIRTVMTLFTTQLLMPRPLNLMSSLYRRIQLGCPFDPEFRLP